MGENAGKPALNFEVDTTLEPLKETVVEKHTSQPDNEEEPEINCLRNERVIVRHIPREG